MPYLFPAEAKYEGGKYLLYNPSDLMSNFPFLDGKTILGKILSIYRDGKIVRVNKEFAAKLVKTGNQYNGEFIEPNPLKVIGLPLPSNMLVTVHKYEEQQNGKTEFPVAEGMLLKGGYSSQFEDEIKRVLREQESGLILEGTVFYPRLSKLEMTTKEAVISFEQENFAHTKTSCRRILEQIREIIAEWKLVDGSQSLCEKLKSVVSSLYSFCSIGGPHEGVTTREETELILKNTTSLLLYANSVLKNERVTSA